MIFLRCDNGVPSNPVLWDDVRRQHPAIDQGKEAIFRIGVFARNFPLNLSGYSGFVLRLRASAEIGADLIVADCSLVAPSIGRPAWEAKTAWNLEAQFTALQTNYQLNVARTKLWCVLSAIDPSGDNVTLGKGEFWLVRDNSAPGAIIAGHRFLTDADADLLDASLTVERTARIAADTAEIAARTVAVADAVAAASADATSKAAAAQAFARQRSNHTGSQSIATITGLQTLLDAIAATDAGQTAAIASIQALLASDDSSLDQIQEIVDYIKLNREDLENLNVAAIAGLQSALDGLQAGIASESNARAAADALLVPKTYTLTAGTGIGAIGDFSAGRTIGLTGQALALHNLATSGLIVRTGTNAVAARSIAGSGLASVSNGSGTLGNPTITVTAATQAQAEAGALATVAMTPQANTWWWTAAKAAPQTISGLWSFDKPPRSSGALTGDVTDVPNVSQVLDLTASGLTCVATADDNGVSVTTAVTRKSTAKSWSVGAGIADSSTSKIVIRLKGVDKEWTGDAAISRYAPYTVLGRLIVQRGNNSTFSGRVDQFLIVGRVSEMAVLLDRTSTWGSSPPASVTVEPEWDGLTGGGDNYNIKITAPGQTGIGGLTAVSVAYKNF